MVKVMTAAVNPSDNFFVIGQYGSTKKFKQLPVGTGLSGAGVVVEVGEGVSEDLIGARVALNQMPSNPGFIGTYRQYTFISAKTVYPFPETMSYDDICNAMGANPITIAGFMETAERDGHSAFINDAAASSLGRMFAKYCKVHKLPLINIVRRKEQVDILKEEGAELILNSSESTFFDDLKAMIDEYKPTAFFDALSGDFPQKVLHLMPSGSTMYVYGALSLSPTVNISGGDLIFKNQTISNFWIPTWIKNTKKDVLMKWMRDIVQDVMEGGTIFGTKVSKTFPLADFDSAMK
ncbi:unnamed protein product [Moneuplotes crassus]|uniref:Uncharacterized protein n=1 Tax=Euplotes crassus TaxID=5936 RepID=A0AAD1XK92_EUPCR|nr:unnamed protein product [Moneuplotes crassus]